VDVIVSIDVRLFLRILFCMSAFKVGWLEDSSFAASGVDKYCVDAFILLHEMSPSDCVFTAQSVSYLRE
jgi:hypothetical protein